MLRGPARRSTCHAARRRQSSRRSQSPIWFQLAKVRLTIPWTSRTASVRTPLIYLWRRSNSSNIFCDSSLSVRRRAGSVSWRRLRAEQHAPGIDQFVIAAMFGQHLIDKGHRIG